MPNLQTGKKGGWQGLAVILAAALAVRLALLLVTEGYATDVSCFSAWAFRLADVGPGQFYAPDYFADYPPAYMLVLWAAGKAARVLGLAYQSKGLALVLGAVPILCDLGLAALVWRIARRFLGGPRALRLAAFAAFCPPLLYDTGVWKQVDGVFALALVEAFWLLHEKKYLPAAAVYGLALAIKPQALLLGPVLAVCFLAPLLTQRQPRGALRVLGRTALGAGISVAVVWLCSLPFQGAQQPAGWLLEKYTGTVNSYPYASLNGFNLLTLLGGNWQPQESRWLGLVSWQALGTIGIAAATLALLWLAWRGAKNGRFCPLLLAAFYGAAVFCLAHRMHERYLIPAILLVLAATARWGDRRLLGAFCLLSAGSLLNLAMVLTSAGTDDQFLTSAGAVLMTRLVSLITLAGFAVLAWAAAAITAGKEVRAYTLPEPGSPAIPHAQPRWRRAEGLFLGAVTLLAALFSLWDLGDTKAPQNPLDAAGATVDTTVVLTEPAEKLWVYQGVSWGGGLTLLDETGRELGWLELGYGSTFQWRELGAQGFAPGRYTVRVENAQVMELSFRTAAQSAAAVEGGGALFDEQALTPAFISYRNSMYFDEIYHGRTAYEHLHGMSVYETTHPPLGKVFIMLGIAAFGMTGFGWRVSGVLFGIAMVPVLYLLVRRLSRSPKAAGFAALLAALDLMRLAQSRIATIDVYGTFFILLSAYFMVWYCQSVLHKGVLKSILPMALCGLAFGLGAASKWTGIYAGAGLAVLYFAVLWQRWRQRQPGFAKELAAALVGGAVFFALVPLAVYIGSYFPYWWREGGFSLAEWWRCQVSMYNYHSQLVATHPFESRWYTWPFDLRPVWYYMGSGLPEGMYASIAGLGNPVVWWAGIAALGAVLWRQLSGRGSGVGGAVTVLFFTQLLPWVLVARCTFLYHYFPSLWFTVAALALVLDRWRRRSPRAARRTAAALLVLAAAAFVWLWPAATGAAVPEAWAASIKWLPSWGFYIIN